MARDVAAVEALLRAAFSARADQSGAPLHGRQAASCRPVQPAFCATHQASGTADEDNAITSRIRSRRSGSDSTAVASQVEQTSAVSVRAGTAGHGAAARPSVHGYVASRAPWFEVRDDLPWKLLRSREARVRRSHATRIRIGIPPRGRSVIFTSGSMGRSGSRERDVVALHGYRQQQDGFHQRELVADAQARPAAQRQVGEAVPRHRRLGREALGIEASGIGPEVRMAMYCWGSIPPASTITSAFRGRALEHQGGLVLQVFEHGLEEESASAASARGELLEAHGERTELGDGGGAARRRRSRASGRRDGGLMAPAFTPARASRTGRRWAKYGRTSERLLRGHRRADSRGRCYSCHYAPKS